MLSIACTQAAAFVPPIVTVVPNPTTIPDMLASSTETPLPSPTRFALDTSIPTYTPTFVATPVEVFSPTPLPSTTPTPTAVPVFTATPLPTHTPTPRPTATGTAIPTSSPEATPTNSPTPTVEPSATPTFIPTPAPTLTPTPDTASTFLANASTGRIAFVSSDGKLWTIKADGSEKTLVAEDADKDFLPLWSPTGDRIAFRENKLVANVPFRSWRVVDLYTQGGPRKIARIDTTGELAWTPDGRRVMYAVEFDGLYEYSLNEETTTKLLTTMVGTIDRDPSWSPKEDKLVFVHYELSTHFFVGLVRKFDKNLIPYAYDETFTQYFHPLIMLLDEGIAILRDQPFRFHWTPNGKVFVYAAEEIGGNKGSLFVADQIVEKVADGITFPARYNMDLSQDGTDIVFATSDGLVVSTLKGRLTTLHEKPGLLHPTWSPDGTHVSFIESNQIGVISKDGATVAYVPNTEGAAMAEWSPVP